MKSKEQLIREKIGEIPSVDPELCIELSERARENNQHDQRMFWILRGFELSKSLQDKPRIQQFSNMLLSLL